MTLDIDMHLALRWRRVPDNQWSVWPAVDVTILHQWYGAQSGPGERASWTQSITLSSVNQ